MLTEKCLRVINEITSRSTDGLLTGQCSCCSNLLHPQFSCIIDNVYVCNGPVATEYLRIHKFTHLINIDQQFFLHNQLRIRQQNTEVIDVNDPQVVFEMLDLSFGHSYSMVVLPNIYTAVKFLEKALENSGKVLIGEGNGHQKSTTILIAFIMYKHRLKFVESFQIIRRLSSLNTVLDTYFIGQLMEYEPILETQRRALLGSSRSSEIRSSRLKRKKHAQDIVEDNSLINKTNIPNIEQPQASSDIETDFLLDNNGNNCNFIDVMTDNHRMET